MGRTQYCDIATTYNINMHRSTDDIDIEMISNSTDDYPRFARYYVQYR